MKMYFTYTSNECGMPFIGGWTEVEAETGEEAVEIFRTVHPNPDGSEVLNCAFVYDEELFNETKMKVEGNFGFFCHEKLTSERSM